MFWLCSVVHADFSNIQYAYFTHIFVTETQKQTVIVLALVETWQLSAYILRDFSKKKKKADKRKKKKRREQKHFIVLYI